MMKSLKAFLNRQIWIVLFVRYLVPVAWKAVNGRFFPWRDTPTWVIREWVDAFEDTELDDFESSLMAAATDELALRNRK